MTNEKIKEQVYDVLDKYAKSYSIDGVLANLEQWQHNKDWLVKLLRHHPNWNEDALAVLFEVTHSREIDSSIVHFYNYQLSQLINHQDVAEDSRNQFLHVLEEVTGTNSKTMRGEDTVALVKKICGVTCSVGQKTSRIINIICKKYGLDQDPEYNARFAKLADSLNPMQVKRSALLSVHPCDYLEMSNQNNSWSSCHCLDCGEYHGGTLSYMNDGCSMIFYTVDDDVSENFHKAPKRTRQVFCYKDGILLQSRLYPQNDDNDTREIYRNIVQRTIADCLLLPNQWILKREHDEVNCWVNTHDDALHYKDYIYMCYKPNISLLKDAGIDEDDTILVGHTAYCLNCAEPVRKTNTTYCDSCYISCSYCGNQVYSDDAHYINGCYYCDECCSYCEDCHEYTTDDTTKVYDTDGNTYCVCESCLSENYHYCCGCDEYVYNDNAEEIDGKFYCKSCAKTKESEELAKCSNGRKEKC